MSPDRWWWWGCFRAHSCVPGVGTQSHTSEVPRADEDPSPALPTVLGSASLRALTKGAFGFQVPRDNCPLTGIDLFPSCLLLQPEYLMHPSACVLGPI